MRNCGRFDAWVRQRFYILKLLQQKNNFQQQLNKQQEVIGALEKKYESLRVANTIVGSKEDKHATKLKINTLIREIDKCIVQLSD